MRIFTLYLIVFAFSLSALNAQYVHIPDTNLMEELLEQGVDSNGDLFICFEEAEAVDSLTLLNGIVDMTGIEAFTNLWHLDCKGIGWARANEIGYLDVSANTALEYLDCGYNVIDTLILGVQDNLLELNIGVNLLTRLDLSNYPNLQTLLCFGNPLIH